MALRTDCLVPIDELLMQRCGKQAQGRQIAKTTHDGQPLFHFTCEAGHVFHTDETCHYFFECDCRPRYAQAAHPRNSLTERAKPFTSA